MAFRIVEMNARARPEPFGVDDTNRLMWSTNFDLVLADAATTRFEDYIAEMIVTASLGVLTGPSSTLFIGLNAPVPSGDGPYTQILVTGGGPSRTTHNGSDYQRPSMQIVTRAKTYIAGSTRALAIYALLNGKYNLSQP